MNDELETAKRLVRAQLGEDLREKLRHLRRREPNLTLEQAWQKLGQEQPELLLYCAQIEADEWPQAPKPVPYRFIDPGPQKTSTLARQILDRLGVERVEAGREE